MKYIYFYAAACVKTSGLPDFAIEIKRYFAA